jgi:hypothetical protein
MSVNVILIEIAVMADKKEEHTGHRKLPRPYSVTLFIALSAFIAWLIESASNQGRNKHKTADKHQREAAKSTNEIQSTGSVIKEESNSTNPHNQTTEYKQTRPYAYAYLATQIFICVAAGVGIPVAICSLQSLNTSTAAATLQAITSQKEFRASRRAWVGIEGPPKMRFPIQLQVPNDFRNCPGP